MQREMKDFKCIDLSMLALYFIEFHWVISAD